jgi:hypothetical protein
MWVGGASSERSMSAALVRYPWAAFDSAAILSVYLIPAKSILLLK